MATDSIAVPLPTEARKVISNVRALLTSRKTPALINEIESECERILCLPIQYKKYGFPNLETFLVASGEFIVRKFNNQITVMVRPNQNSEHIAGLVRLSKTSKAKGYYSDPARPLRKNTMSTQHASVPSVRSLPVKSVRKFVMHGGPSYPNLPPRIVSGLRSAAYGNSGGGGGGGGGDTLRQSQNNDIWRRPNPGMNNNDYNNIKPFIPPLMPGLTGTSSRFMVDPPIATMQRPIVPQAFPIRHNRNVGQPVLNAPRPMPILQRGNSVNDRLRVVMPQQQTVPIMKVESFPNSGNLQERADTAQLQRQIQSQAQSHSQSQSNTPIEQLEQICARLRLMPPIYKSFKLKSGAYQTRVTIGESIYSTYPIEKPSEAESKMYIAIEAIKQIQEKESRERYPVCMDEDFEIAVKLLNILKKFTNGLFSKGIPEMFLNEYNQSLPDNWFSIITAFPKFFSLEDAAYGNIIVFGHNVDPKTAEMKPYEMRKLVLPWTAKHWDIYVSNPASTVEIWARIIGPNYSNKMDSMLTDIELHMLTEKKRPEKVVVGNYYLFADSECWSRVRVDQLDSTKQLALCFSIDLGDEEWHPIEKLYSCEKRFLELAPQAIILSLDGLEDFDGYKTAKAFLHDTLASKTLIAFVHTSADDYTKQDESSDVDAKITVTLYDTSSDEDVNLNQTIVRHICEQTVPPKLDRVGVTHVTITHVCSNGDIYCHILHMGMDNIQKLIYRLVKANFQHSTEHRGLYNKPSDITELYLVCDPIDSQWYRAIVQDRSATENEATVFYVDYGLTRSIKHETMYRLENISVALSRYPFQALKLKLYNIPTFTDNMIARVKGLLMPNTPAIIKVMNTALVPFCNIYRRIEHQNILVCVNTAIRDEQELDQTSEPIETTMLSQLSLNAAKTDLVAPRLQSAIVKLRTSEPRQKLKAYALPKINTLLDVRVTMASSPNFFIVQPYDDSTRLNDLMHDLQKYCTNAAAVPIQRTEIGEPYAALDPDGNWYRAIVEHVYNNSSMIHVSYVDFGNVNVVYGIAGLRELPDQFRTLPKQAIRAKLYGVYPKFVDWTMDDSLRFQTLTVNQNFASILRSVREDELCAGETLVELSLIDVSTDDDIYIHDKLVEEERAVMNKQ